MDLRKKYIASINRVIDYISNNLTQELSLETLSAVAGFSPFHFHRLFKAFMNETLNAYIKRIRLEKAIYYLSVNADMSVTEIAYQCGFSSAQAMARDFQKQYNKTPSDYRKICNSDSKNWKDQLQALYYDEHITKEKGGELDMNVKVQDMPEMHIAYVRHIGPYKGDSKLFEGLFNTLMGWAGPRGLFVPQKTKILTVYYDDPHVTDEKKLRVDAAITIDEGVEVEGEIGKSTIPTGKYAIASFGKLGSDEYEQAWNQLYKEWLPESGYQPADGPCYENYLSDPKQDPDGKCDTQICIPVKPA